MGLRVVMLGTRGAPARYGGFETAVEEIGSRLARDGHDVTVYCRSGNSGEATDPTEHLGMRLIHLPCLRHRSLETLTHTILATLHLVFGRQRPDVVLLFNSANAFALPLLRLRRIPTAVHVDGLEWRRAKWGKFGRGFYRHSEALSVRSADALIADAPGIQNYYEDEFGATTTLIEYGSPVLDGTAPDRLTEVGLTPRGYHLVVARMEPENHVDLMIQAYAHSRTRLPLVVVSGTPYPTEYSRGVDELAARTEGVQMMGGVWDQELLDHLYIGAASYLHGHSVGGTNPSLLRAMGAGTHTIAHDNVFNRGVLGSLGAFGGTVDELVIAIEAADANPEGSQEVRDQMVSRIRERYDWDLVADNYADLCAELASGMSQRRQFSGRRNPDSGWQDVAETPAQNALHPFGVNDEVQN